MYSKFEVARIIGARSLQIAMGAPILAKRPKNMYNPITIARLEFKNGVLPITVKRSS